MIAEMTITSPDGENVLGVFYENNKLYAGYIFNSGCSKDWEIDYDKDFTFEENLQHLYEVISQDFNNYA